MNNSVKLFPILFLFCFFLSNCADSLELPEDDNPCAPYECDTTLSEIEQNALWSYKFHNNERPQDVGEIFKNRGYLYIHYKTPTSRIERSRLGSGIVEWEWKDFQNLTYDHVAYAPSQDKIIVHDRRRIAAIDGLTGITTSVFIQNEGDAESPGYLLNEYYYYERHFESWHETKYLVRSHVNDLQDWDTVYSANPDDFSVDRLFIEGINYWRDANSGDEFLLFIHSGYPPTKYDIAAYNLTERKIEWMIEDVSSNEHSNMERLLIREDRVYFVSQKSLHCIDIPSGDIVWEHLAGGESYSSITPPLYIDDENTIVVRSSESFESYLYKFDALTGESLKKSKSLELGQSSSMAYYNHIIYLVAKGEIKSIDARTLSLKNSVNYGIQGPVHIFPDEYISIVNNGTYLYALEISDLDG